MDNDQDRYEYEVLREEYERELNEQEKEARKLEAATFKLVQEMLYLEAY